jgi:hypothetical protein
MRVPVPALAAIAIAAVVGARLAEPIAAKSRCVGLVKRQPSAGKTLAEAAGPGSWSAVANDSGIVVGHGEARWSCDGEPVPLIVPLDPEARRLTPGLVPPES